MLVHTLQRQQKYGVPVFSNMIHILFKSTRSVKYALHLLVYVEYSSISCTIPLEIGSQTKRSISYGGYF